MDRSPLHRLIGTTRAERLATAGILIAVVVAVVGFFALDNGAGDGDGRSSAEEPATEYVREADALCVAAKRGLAEAGQAALAEGKGQLDDVLTGYAAATTRINSRLRRELAGLDPDPGLDAVANRLDARLGRLSQGTRKLERVAASGDPGAIQAQLIEIETAAAEAETLVDALGLSRCAQLEVGLARLETE